MLTKEDKKYLQDVLSRYAEGSCSLEEARFVDEYFNYLDALNERRDPFQESGIESREEVEAAIKDRLLRAIRSGTPTETTGTVRRLRVYYGRVAAAAVFLILCAGLYWFLARRHNATTDPAANLAADFRPGSNRALLTVTNGQTIVLDSNSGNIIQESGLTVSNQSGELTYEGKAENEQIHTLSVPIGGQYKLKLPDGSEVWLNSASSITYPAAFNDTERVVEVTGEVYFEVASRKQQPFKVRMPKGREIEVLGTHFNVNTYDDEPAAVTTLLEGSIQFETSGKKVKLSPGQQARSKAAGEVMVYQDVDTGAVIAWKEGYFNFNGADLPTVMRQISRWYNVSVEYEGRIPEMKFSGEIAKSNNASMVLKMLEAAKLQFQIKGSRIIVKQ